MDRYSKTDWLDNEIPKTEPSRQFRPDFKQWCLRHPQSLSAFRERMKSNSTGYVDRAWHDFPVKPVLAAVVLMVFGLLAYLWIQPDPPKTQVHAIKQPNTEIPIVSGRIKLQEELALAESYYRNEDTLSLIDLLKDGMEPTKVKTAHYLGLLDVNDALPILHRLSSQWQGPIAENPFAQAIEAMMTPQKELQVPPEPVSTVIHDNTQAEDSEPMIPDPMDFLHVTQYAHSSIVELKHKRTVTGYVYDPNGQAVTKAQVVVLPITTCQTMTDENGYFELAWSPQWYPKGNPMSLLVRDIQNNLATVTTMDSPVSPVSIQLEPAHVLTVKVPDHLVTGTITRTATGEVTYFARVTVSLADPSGVIAPFLTTRTDDGGVVVFSSLPYGQKYSILNHGSSLGSVELTQPVDYETNFSYLNLTEDSLVMDGRTLPANHDPSLTRNNQPSKVDMQRMFNQVYALQKNEYVKFVKCPLIRERHFLLLNKHSNNMSHREGEFRESIYIWRDNETRVKSTWLGGPWRLSLILNLLIELHDHEFYIPETLKDITLPMGEWARRESSTVVQELKALEEILYAESGRKIYFEPSETKDEYNNPLTVWLVLERD